MANLGFKMEVSDSVIINRAMCMQELAISKTIKVGCVIQGIRKRVSCEGGAEYEYFGGCNIEINTSKVYHAEMIALVDCIMYRFYPIRLFVTSVSKEEDTYLCGDCRQQLLEINKNCEIIVLNPDGSLKGSKLLWELLPKHKNVDEKNNRYHQLLFGGN